VARRKLLAVFTALVTFGLVATVNKYLYLEEEAKEKPLLAAARSREATESSDDPSVEEEIRISKAKLKLGQRRTVFLAKEEDKPDYSNREDGYGIQQMPQAAAAAPKRAKIMEDDDEEMDDVEAEGSKFVPKRLLFHLDLKGAPPKVSYLKEIFPLVADAGATHVLLEYEDMFPFRGPLLANVSALNAYSMEDVRAIAAAAKEANLAVIPLVQTFGHLEFLLKLEEYREMREVPWSPQAICPWQERSWQLIRAVIDQVAEAHPDAKWLHVGCDEVFQLAQCPVCSERVAAKNADPSDSSYYDGRSLFLDHVHRVGSYVRDRWGMKAIVWDDMMRTIPEETLVRSEVGHVVEPMVWVYVEDVDRFVDPTTWNAFAAVFPHVWAASAFKGAFGERLYMVNVQRHVGNNMGWLEVMRREATGSNKVHFRGIALTGWSRYDHFAVLCELLPAAVPSLILNLMALKLGGLTAEATKRAGDLLACPASKAPMTNEELMRSPEQWDLHRCSWPGAEVFVMLSTYDLTRKEVEGLYERVTQKDGWMTDYNVKHR